MTGKLKSVRVIWQLSNCTFSKIPDCFPELTAIWQSVKMQPEKPTSTKRQLIKTFLLNTVLSNSHLTKLQFRHSVLTISIKEKSRCSNFLFLITRFFSAVPLISIPDQLFFSSPAIFFKLEFSALI